MLKIPLPPGHSEPFDTEHLLIDLKERSYQGITLSLYGQGVKFALNLGSTAILARILKPSDFGLLAMVAGIIGFLDLFKDPGLGLALVQREKIDHSQINALFWIGLALSGILSILIVLLAPLAVWFYGEPRLYWIMILSALPLVFSGLAAQQQALLRRRMRFGALAAIDLTSLTAGILTAVLMALQGAGYWSLLGLALVSSLVHFIMSWVAGGWRPGWPSHTVGLRTLLTFGGKITGFTGINYFTRNADNVIIGYSLGSSPLGIYSKAYSLLLSPISQINVPVGTVMIPALSRLKNDPDRYQRYFLETLRGLALISMPLVFFLYIEAPSIILVLLGEKWLQAAPVFRRLAPAALVGTVNIAPIWLCLSLDRTQVLFRWSLLSAPIVITGFFIGVRWGIEGVAASFSLTWGLAFMVLIHRACRNTPVSFCGIIQAVALPCLSSLAAAIGIWGVQYFLPRPAHPLLQVLFSFTLFGIMYLGVFYATPSGRNFLHGLPALLRGWGLARLHRPVQ